MSKDKISDYSATANSNTDIAGINIDEGCAPSGINNAIRTLMKQLKDFQQGTNSDSFNGPTNGAHNGTVGATTPAAGTFTTLTASGNVVLGDASTDTLNVGNGGLIKDASGNLGLGVTPSAWVGMQGGVFQNAGSGSLFSRGTNEFCVGFNAYYNSGTGYKYINSRPASNYQQVDGAHQWYNAASGTAGNAITFTQAMTLDASGNLLVGATSANFSASGRGNINVNGSSDALLALTKGGSSSVAAYFYFDGTDAEIRNINSGALKLSTNNTERARIDSSGNLLLGTTNSNPIGSNVAGIVSSPSGNFSVSRDAAPALDLNRYTSDGTLARFYRSATQVGSISVTTTATAYNTSSDYRLKDVTGNLTGYKERVMSLQPKQGTWKANGAEFRGFLAHEFAESYRSSVTGEKDEVDSDGNPVMQAMQPSTPEVMADLVALVQELVTENQSLKARLDAANL